MLTDKIYDFYSDMNVHTNDELYDCFNAYENEERHILRGMQQAMKRNDILLNVGYGEWMLNPQRVVSVDENGNVIM